MRIFPPEVEVDDYEGFTPEKDIFNLKEFGESLRNLFENVEDPMVAILDEPWGAGKSTFIKMWCGHMRLHGFPVIYFDAFKHDYSDDAFVAIAGEVVAAAQDLSIPDTTTQEFINNAAQVGAQVASVVGKGLLKRGVQKMLGQEGEEELSEIVSDSTQVTFDGLESVLKVKLANRRQERKSFKKFGDILDSVAINMSSQLQNYLVVNGIDGKISNTDNSRRSLIVVIDELDRCKPTFALEVLEKIKHFFSREGIHFFLVTHMKQLESAVSEIYGLTELSEEYLDKFYTIRLEFPSIDGVHGSAQNTYFDYLKKFVVNHNDFTSIYLTNSYEVYSCRKQVSLRGAQKIATRFFLAITNYNRIYQNNLTDYDQDLIMVLCLMRSLDKDLYSKVRNRTIRIDDVCSFLNIEIPNFEDESEVNEELSIMSAFLVPKNNIPDKIEAANVYVGSGEVRLEQVLKVIELVQ